MYSGNSATVERNGYATVTSTAQAWSGILLLMPSVIMWRECVLRSNAVRACVIFHAYMVMVLLMNRNKRPAPEPPRQSKEVPVTGFGIMLAIGLVAYIFCRSASVPGEYLGVPLNELRQTLELYGIRSQVAMTAFALYFAVINPILEELFWRRFARARLGEEYSSKLPLLSWGSSPADALSASAYSAYHSVIIAMLMPAWFNFLVAFPFLVAFGHALSLLADKHGIHTAIAVHSGLDLAAACWILDIKFGFLDSYFIPVTGPTHLYRQELHNITSRFFREASSLLCTELMASSFVCA